MTEIENVEITPINQQIEDGKNIEHIYLTMYKIW